MDTICLCSHGVLSIVSTHPVVYKSGTTRSHHSFQNTVYAQTDIRYRVQIHFPFICCHEFNLQDGKYCPNGLNSALFLWLERVRSQLPANIFHFHSSPASDLDSTVNRFLVQSTASCICTCQPGTTAQTTTKIGVVISWWEVKFVS